jgi:hypothetical protein
MKRKIELLFLSVVVVAAAAAVILTRPSAKREAPAQARTRPAPAAEAVFVKETTVRNVTDRTIPYRIYPGGRPEKLESREIAPAEIHRFRTREHLEIEFNTGEKDVNYSLDPGKPYSFRYDEKLIDLFVGSHGRADAEDLAPYVPTPQVVVDRMLEMARVTSRDVVYDIGCGDGRIVITAARKYGARGVGIDIDPEMIDESRHNARGAGIEPLVSFICMDATKADISEATVVTLYLLPESNALLRPIFDQQLKPGTRVVSHNYEIPGWEHKQVEALSMKDEEGSDHNIFSYVR